VTLLGNSDWGICAVRRAASRSTPEAPRDDSDVGAGRRWLADGDA